MVKLTQDYILRLKSMCDIEFVVSNYVELKFSGKNKKCCCPFHSEKTPSFVVFKETKSFFCFGCGVGGDVITFVEKIENLDYVSAVKFLAKMCGLEPPEDYKDEFKSRLRSKILDINREAAKFFHDNLFKDEGKFALKYLTNIRGLSKNIINKFGLGYSLNGWDFLKNHLKNKGYSYEEIEKSDLILKSKKGGFYDRFRDRIMFPIIDLKGFVVGFGGRSIKNQNVPKYLNSADTLVFKKSLGLFGLNFAKKSSKNYFLLCEGYLDVISLFQFGFENAVASLGTSITKEQVLLLKRSFKNVVLAYDMDLAGKKALKRAYFLFEEVGIKTKVLNFNGAKDPDEFVRKFGAVELKKQVKKAITLEEIEFSNLLKKYNLNDLEQKRKYVEDYCKIVSFFKNPIKKEIYVGELCSKLNLDRYVVLKYVKSQKNKINRRSLNYNKNFDFRVVDKINLKKNKDLPLKIIRAEQGVLRYLFYNPEFLKNLESLIKENIFNVKWHKKVYFLLQEAIKQKKQLDISIFRDELKKKELSDFVKIINFSKIYKNDLDEVLEYVKLIKEFCEEKKQNVLEMSLNELEEKRQKKAELKS